MPYSRHSTFVVFKKGENVGYHRRNEEIVALLEATERG